MPTCSNSSRALALRSARLPLSWIRSASPIWKPAVKQGLRLVIGSWKIIAIWCPVIFRRCLSGMRNRSCSEKASTSGYIDEALVRFGDAEIFFASHLWPTWGNANITRYMKQQRDAYKYIHDQTVRMINAGMKPDEIAEQITLPEP